MTSFVSDVCIRPALLINSIRTGGQSAIQTKYSEIFAAYTVSNKFRDDFSIHLVK